MTRQHNKTPEIIRLRILASLVSWPRLGWWPGLLLPFMMTYALRSLLTGMMPVPPVLRMLPYGLHLGIVKWQQRPAFQTCGESPEPDAADTENRRPVHPVKLRT